MVFDEASRPSVRWLHNQKKRRAIPYLKVGRLVRYDPDRVLRSLGLGANGQGIALPLFSFNLGVEIGQVSIAAVVLPVIWRLRKNPDFARRGGPIVSALVAAMGLYWLLERTLFKPVA